MYSVTSTASYFAPKNRARSRLARRSKKSLLDPLSHLAGSDVTINVSGTRFRLHESHLVQHPDSLLGSTDKYAYFDQSLDEFFFDRDPHMFRFIHKFYKTGKLHQSPSDCYEAFTEELEFFGIQMNEVAYCCGDDLIQHMVDKANKQCELSDESFEEERIVFMRERFWHFCEDPSSSLLAKLFHLLSCSMIILAMVTMSVETVECERVIQDNSTVVVKCGDVYVDLFFTIDTVCVCFFLMEYAVRLYGAPNRLVFAKSIMSIVDVLAILPYFITLLQHQINVRSNVANNVIVAFRSLRIVRVLKLARHSRRLRQLSGALARSTSELGFIVFMYCVLVVLFATIIYYAENLAHKSLVFSSIPEAMWYTVVTTTTLGYGDIVPETVQGRLIGALCCLMGVLVIALPVPIIQMKSKTESE